MAWHNYKDTKNHFLTIRFEGRILRVDEQNIVYLKAFDNYCYIVTTSETYLVPHTLKYIEEQIQSKSQFVKCHRSYIVNLGHVIGLEKNKLQLRKENIPISNSQKSLVISRLNNQ